MTTRKHRRAQSWIFGLGWGIGLLAAAGTASQAAIEPPPALAHAAGARFPGIESVAVFEPKGESNVRSSFRLRDGVGLIGTEETGDIFKTEDAGRTWRKVWDGGEAWKIQDVRNYLRAQDGHVYITTSEPALVARSEDEGETWTVLARPQSSRTVGLVQLDDGTMLVGLRRSENGLTSIVRSEDNFESYAWLPLSNTEPRQNVTTFGYWGGATVLAGIGYEGAGKLYLSRDRGKTWVKKTEFADARDLMGFFRSGEATFVLASGVATLFRSDDAGETWQESRRFWPKGFLGQCVPLTWQGRTLWVMSATDQTESSYRHVLLISDDPAGQWFEWIELGRDTSGGASNLAWLSPDTLVVGTGNHAAQGRAYTLKILGQPSD